VTGQREKYVRDGKTYFADLDLERAAVRNADRLARKMPPDKKEAFLFIADRIRRAIIWERFRGHVIDSLQTADPSRRPFNIYDLQRRMNKVLRDSSRWVWRNQSFGEAKLREYTAQLALASLSICRLIDKAATCWDKRALSEIRNGS
jgi:hypothetical protein